MNIYRKWNVLICLKMKTVSTDDLALTSENHSQILAIYWTHTNNFHTTAYTLEVILFRPQCANLQFPILKWKTGIFFCLCHGSHQANILANDRRCLHWYELKLARTQLENAPLFFSWWVLALTLPWNWSTNISGQALITSCSRLETSL